MNEELLEAMFGKGRRGLDGPTILPEAAIERLREVAARIEAGNPFKPGDIVTPRVDALIKGAGDPHIVTRIFPDAPMFTGEPGGWLYACRHDTQIISVVGDYVAVHVTPHWMLEPYRPA